MTEKSVLRIAALADIHCRKTSAGEFQQMFKEAAQSADVILMAGDLTDNGTAEEAHVLVKEMATPVKVPIFAVLGNHDYQSDKHEEVDQILTDAGINVLNGESVEIFGVGFAGTKGFAGGFGASMLGPWGEPAIKAFVHEAVEEALKLEAALARLHTPIRVAMTHYSPIQATVEGERREIFSFLGSSRLEEPINRHGVKVVFHGHAHVGTLEGRTSTGIPVYNVALPLLRARMQNQPRFRLYELDLSELAQLPEKPPEPAVDHAYAAEPLVETHADPGQLHVTSLTAGETHISRTP
ncbi:MAG: metallophosphoesterase family protein [Terriglobales bacterium]